MHIVYYCLIYSYVQDQLTAPYHKDIKKNDTSILIINFYSFLHYSYRYLTLSGHYSILSDGGFTVIQP
jgi:hypothetical protein